MNIHVEVIPHEQQLYETTGDWRWDQWGNLHIKISDVENWKSETLVAIHEIIEAMLCKARDIKEEDVSAFDIEHPELADPGLNENAPYHKEHMIAVFVEKMLCNELGIPWEEHYETI